MMRKVLLILCLAVASVVSAGELRLARHYSDHMVLQRDKPVVVRGQATPGAEVTVAFNGQEKAAKTDGAGQWAVTLEPMAAVAKAQELTVAAGKERLVLREVVIGDVILFARQTTIDISLGRDEVGRQAAKAHKVLPGYRALVLRSVPSMDPLEDLPDGATAGWAVVDKSTALTMSAAAYYLGRDVSAAVDVPIGIVDANLGGQFPVAWLSRESAEQIGGMDRRIDTFEAMRNAFVNQEPWGKDWRARVLTDDPLEHPLYGAAGYNGLLHPLRGLALKGIILQMGNDYPYMYYNKLKAEGRHTDRGALNQAYIDTYEMRKEGFRMEPQAISLLLPEWRNVFADDTLPMALVMPPASELSTYAIHNREMRELQRIQAMHSPEIDVILPGMEAVPFSGQPRDEALLAARSLAWVKGALLKQSAIPVTGPEFERLEANGKIATVHFKAGTAVGLTAAPGALDAFEVADVNGKYVPAKAVIDAQTIKLACEELGRIFYVRYNWRERPDEGLTNSAGLPAIPFRTQDVLHQWFIRNDEEDLPEEYSLPANQWKGGLVTFVNGQLDGVGYLHFSGWFGPIGFRGAPFGPNIAIKEVKAGSPAPGKLLVGDVIYSVNGQLLGEQEEMVLSAAITEAEATDGKLVLGVYRDGELLDIEINLPVMGRYSATAPWNCPKTDRIVANLEQYLVDRGLPDGYLYTDLLFMLAAGSPEYQGELRRRIQTHVNDKRVDGSNWHVGYLTILLSEYVLTTGDKSALPRIQQLVDHMAAMQMTGTTSPRLGGWRTRGEGRPEAGYPAMVHVAVSNMIGMTLAREAGATIDETCYQLGLDYLRRKGAHLGVLIYGDAFRKEPRFIDPDEMLAGKLGTDNGKVGEAAIFFRLIGDRPGQYINSLISTHAWYSTYDGHGGNFWNNFWTPLGPFMQNKESMIYFMKNHRWYRECNRMFDGSLQWSDGGKFGGGTGVALVVPRQRLRILGAQASPFGIQVPAELKPALAAYEAHDYDKALELALAQVPAEARGKVNVSTAGRLVEEIERMQAGITGDLARLDALLAEGRVYEAGRVLEGLVPVMAGNDPVLLARQEALAKTRPRDNDEERYQVWRKTRTMTVSSEKEPENSEDLKKLEAERAAAAKAAAEALGTWQCLTPKVFVSEKAGQKAGFGQAPQEEATQWRMLVLERLNNAPVGWMQPGFDDSRWVETTYPISWHLNHPMVARATFQVEDPKAFDALRFRSWVFRQQNMTVYLNGVLVARVNNVMNKTGEIEADLKDEVLGLLKEGENTIAVSTIHNWRWGMLFMKVYNNGFDFMLDGRIPKREPES